jgi:hypothetical protein
MKKHIETTLDKYEILSSSCPICHKVFTLTLEKHHPEEASTAALEELRFRASTHYKETECHKRKEST